MKFLELIPRTSTGAFVYGVEIEFGAQLRVTLIFDPLSSTGVEQLRGREIPRSLGEACRRLHDAVASEKCAPPDFRPLTLSPLSRIYLGWHGVCEHEYEDWYDSEPVEGGISPGVVFYPPGTLFQLASDPDWVNVLSREEALLRGVVTEEALAEAEMRHKAGGEKRRGSKASVEMPRWPGPRPEYFMEGISLQHQTSGIVFEIFYPELIFRKRTLRAIRDVARELAPLTEPIWSSKMRRFGAKGRGIVFLSYRIGHEDFAERLAKALLVRGFRPWLDRWEIHPGDSIPQRISEAFEQSDAYVPIITGDFPKGKWASKELRTAITKAIDDEYLIIPILHDSGRLPELLREIRAIDCNRDSPFMSPKHVDELVKGLRRISEGVVS